MKKVIASLGVIALVASGCASVSEDVQLTTANGKPSQLLVYRVSAIGFAAFDMSFGFDDNYFTALGPGEYALIDIDSGEYTFEASLSTSQDTSITLNVPAGEVTCVKAEVTDAASVLGALAVMAAKGVTLEEVECPNSEELAKYRHEQKYDKR